MKGSVNVCARIGDWSTCVCSDRDSGAGGLGERTIEHQSAEHFKFRRGSRDGGVSCACPNPWKNECKNGFNTHAPTFISRNRKRKLPADIRFKTMIGRSAHDQATSIAIGRKLRKHGNQEIEDGEMETNEENTVNEIDKKRMNEQPRHHRTACQKWMDRGQGEQTDRTYPQSE